MKCQLPIQANHLRSVRHVLFGEGVELPGMVTQYMTQIKGANAMAVDTTIQICNRSNHAVNGRYGLPFVENNIII
jgi:hypothetical protein